MAQSTPRGLQLFCWLFIVLGVGITGWGGWTLIRSVRTNDWPVTEGVIQSARQESHRGTKGGTTYSAEVTYTYQVAKASYTGSKIAIGQMSSSSEYAQGVLSRYPVGGKVAVHYSATDPADAVLETGIHGGTWICFGVGTVFALFGVMFLQIMKAAAKAQTTDALQPGSTRPATDGSTTTSKAPLLMGVIFLIAGVGICFGQPSGGTPQWIVYAAGGMFGMVGVYIFLAGLKNKLYAKIAMVLMLVLFLVIFHWVSFGPGERIGTSTTPLSQQRGVSVKTPFAIATILMDVVIIALVIRRLRKGKSD